LPIKIGTHQKIAFFLRSNSKLYESVKSKAFAFHFFDLAQPIDLLMAQIADLQADIIIAPPSVLMELAQKIESKQMQLSPKKIIAVAEVLEKDIKKRLEKIFGQTIHQVYQATEGFLGSTCAHGTLHLHEDIIFFEKKYTDATQKSFYPIISDFSRRTQPMIRYELNDLLHERETPCPCDSIFTAIDHIEGRSDDILTFGEVKIFPDFFRYAVLLASDDILNFQIEQIADNQLIIRLKTIKTIDKNALQNQVKMRVNDLLFKNNVNNCNIIFEELNHVDFYNKFRRVLKQKNR
jgi:putative adenylate-forming enzyme